MGLLLIQMCHLQVRVVRRASRAQQTEQTVGQTAGQMKAGRRLYQDYILPARECRLIQACRVPAVLGVLGVEQVVEQVTQVWPNRLETNLDGAIGEPIVTLALFL